VIEFRQTQEKTNESYPSQPGGRHAEDTGGNPGAACGRRVATQTDETLQHQQGYDIQMAAARRGYENPEDRSHWAHTLHTTLSAAQELIVVELRRLLELPLDDLLVVTRRFINSEVSRSGLNRLLQREGLGSLRALRAARAKAAEEKDAAAKKKGFKEYAPGFIHIDIKYLPRMPNETSRRYLFVAIDCASRCPAHLR
jgi:hypothetical protein